MGKVRRFLMVDLLKHLTKFRKYFAEKVNIYGFNELLKWLDNDKKLASFRRLR